MSAPFTTAAGPDGTHYLSIQGPQGIHVPYVHRDYAAFVASRMTAAYEAGQRQAEDAAALAAFADCEGLIVSMLEAMSNAEAENGRSLVAFGLRSAALAVSLGQHRTDAYDPDRLAAAHRAAGVRPLAARGGRATSPAKAASSRANGRRGGRPKKVTETP